MILSPVFQSADKDKIKYLCAGNKLSEWIAEDQKNWVRKTLQD